MIQLVKPKALGPKSWGLELLVAHTKDYIGKVLSMRAGTSGPFQYHVTKDETFYLYSGVAEVRYRDDGGFDHIVEMQPGDAYWVPPGSPHQVTAISDCVLFEVSTPVFDDRVAVSPTDLPCP